MLVNKSEMYTVNVLFCVIFFFFIEAQSKVGIFIFPNGCKEFI